MQTVAHGLLPHQVNAFAPSQEAFIPQTCTQALRCKRINKGHRMGTLEKEYSGWNTDSHVNTFDVWSRLGSLEFQFKWGAFIENRMLIETIKKATGPIRMLEVGCATGATVRWLKSNSLTQRVQYTGIDISEQAISTAKKNHPGYDFRVVSPDFLAQQTENYDLVFSRDTVMHQTDPNKFLDELLKVTGKTLILRLRTRDNGPTEWNVDLSCQQHYDGFWMPYIVINTDDLISRLLASNKISQIELNKSYEVLGGQNYRFLPKDLYFTSAGGAETSVRISCSETNANPGRKPEITVSTLHEGQQLIRSSTLKRGFFSVLRGLGIRL